MSEYRARDYWPFIGKKRTHLRDRMMTGNWAWRVEYFPHWLERVLCFLRRRHLPIDDHCGKPEHRYCWRCGTRTPYQQSVL